MQDETCRTNWLQTVDTHARWPASDWGLALMAWPACHSAGPCTISCARIVVCELPLELLAAVPVFSVAPNGILRQWSAQRGYGPNCVDTTLNGMQNKPYFQRLEASERASEPKRQEANTRVTEKDNKHLLGLVFPIKTWLVFGEVAFGLGLGISEILKILLKIIHFLMSSEKSL